jgi:hypothetical protein
MCQRKARPAGHTPTLPTVSPFSLPMPGEAHQSANSQTVAHAKSVIFVGPIRRSPGIAQSNLLLSQFVVVLGSPTPYPPFPPGLHHPPSIHPCSPNRLQEPIVQQTVRPGDRCCLPPARSLPMRRPQHQPHSIIVSLNLEGAPTTVLQCYSVIVSPRHVERSPMPGHTGASAFRS